MKEIALTILIAVALESPAQAQTVPSMPTLSYPEQGVFCGFMTMCTPKAVAPADRAVSQEKE